MASDKTKIYTSKQKELFGRKHTTEDRGQSYNNVVCFPSTTAIDVHQGFKNGILTEDTLIIAVERVKSRRASVKKQLNKHTKNYYVAGTDAHRLKLDKFLPSDEKIDYLPYDMCGNYTAAIAGWFYRNQKRFADGMRMSVTLTAVNRRPETFDEIKKVAGDKVAKTVSKALKNAEFAGVGGFCLTSEMREHIASQVFMLINSMPDKHIEINRATIYANTEFSSQAKHMVVLDSYVYDAESDVRKTNVLNRIVRGYNQKVGIASQVRLTPKVKKARAARKEVIATISLLDKYDSIEDVKPQDWAHVTRRAIKNGKNPIMAKAGVKAAFSRRANK